MNFPRCALIVGFVLVQSIVSTSLAVAQPAETVRRVGVAAVDITPDYPVRLNGFGNRRTESEGVTQRIWAKAIAINDDDDDGDDGDGGKGTSVLLTVDNLGVPDYMTREVATRLAQKAKLDPARLAITSTHTHTAPMLTDCLPTIFGTPIAPEEQETIDRYTRELTDDLEQVALAAIADVKPARLEYGIGRIDIAINRRTQGGPVDHDLPVMLVKDPAGKLRAIYTSYACHCVTLSNNQISGDWAGYAQELLQKEHPGVIALTSVGCGADANPSARGSVDIAAGQGTKIAAEVARLLQTPLTPLDEPIATTLNRIELPFDNHPTRAEWEERAKQQDAIGYHARVQLARLDRGEKLQTILSYPIQTWTFGDQLAMVFLPGEVVVDYSLRLKREFDRNRIWINGYSNDVPCYIPSERILKEGGYEADGAMIFYDRPTRLASGIEQKIIDEVHRQLPKSFIAPAGTEGIAPRSAADSLRAIRTRPGLEIELVVSEPLVTAPVAIDGDAQGRMWVCEMYDYPTGAGANWEPGGRVRVLTDTDGDGTYDKADVFLDKLPFPTGVTAWGRGVLISAAPDIIYAEDTDGDGKADKIEKRFTGFATDNYQGRVNSLALGLDNWIHGANGLLGGVIEGSAGKLDIRGHDFRFHPRNGRMELVGGLTQQGRGRDDYGMWFGCDNSNALFVYPHAQRYFRRNPHAPAPPASVNPRGDFDVARLYPISRATERYNHPESANRVTAAAGIGVYRDTLLGDAYYGNTFTCESVHNLVHRLVLDGEGSNLTRQRDAGERESEFLASTDNWFRPVQARTGPDGALYIVDMYRFLIEHPRWIPAERLAQLDVRAGANMGRIYRVRPSRADAKLRPVRDLTKLSAADLATAIDSPNGTERDRVHVELLHRDDVASAQTLVKIAAEATLPRVRVQALAALDGIGALQPAHVARGLKDADAQVRKHAVRLAETTRDAGVESALYALAADPSALVRTQLAFTLGELDDPRAGAALGKLAAVSLDDADLRFAALSSAAKHCGPILAAVMDADEKAAGRAAWIPPLVATAAASSDDRLLAAALTAVLPMGKAEPTAAHFTALAGLLDALERKGFALPVDAAPRVERVRDAARKVAADGNAMDSVRLDALKVLGRGETSSDELDVLCRLATEAPGELRAAAMASVARQTDPGIATRLLGNWRRTSPAARADVINLLLGRDAWAAALLHAVKDKRVAVQEVSLADRQRLVESTSDAIRELAAETFPSTGTGSRAEVLRQYGSVASLMGDAARGQEVFAKNCIACHAFGGAGHDVGPDLAPLRDKDADYFVKNILDPNVIVEPRFVNYTVVLKNKRVLAGVIKSETASDLVLSVGAGATETVTRADIKDIRASSSSMMPEGFEAGISPEQMADLIAYVKSGAGSPRKQMPGNAPALVKQAGDGSIVLPATMAEIYGEGPILLESEFKNIGYWSDAADHVAWLAQVDKPGDYDVHIDYACANDSAGNEFIVGSGAATLAAAVKGTGDGWSNYRQVKLGTVRLAAGQQRVTVRAEGPVRNALMDLRAVAFAPAGVAPKWPASTRAAPPADRVMRDAPTVAQFILDKTNSTAARDAAVNANPQFSAELITEMTRDLPAGAPEYERIPWIWRVAIAAGKRNQAPQLRKVIDVSLPRDDEPLRDWQAVVIGGGVINGITQAGAWPAGRVAEVIGDDAEMQARWNRAMDLASPMSDDEKVPPGTRYDALRMLGVEPWDKHGQQLVRYLGKDVHAELQMGGVSGAGDVRDPRATTALIAALPGLTEGSRKLALHALVRDEQRVAALKEAVAAGKVDASLLDADVKQRLVMPAR